VILSSLGVFDMDKKKDRRVFSERCRGCLNYDPEKCCEAEEVLEVGSSECSRFEPNPDGEPNW